MNRRILRLCAVIGTATVSTLAVAPVFAAATVSQATAQSLQLSIAGNSAVSQQVSASNDGSTETKNDASTVPLIADLVPANTLLHVGVAPQEARAFKDGTSYACAGIAGTGGGIATVGHSSCNVDGKPLTINLANLSLGNALLTNDSALGSALNGIPGIGGTGGLLDTLGVTLNQLVTQVSGAINGTPLGEIGIGGSLSAIEGTCTANPDSATGDARLVDTSGGSAQTPITLNLPGVAPIVLVNLPANPPPNTHVLTGLDTVTQSVINGLKQELATAIQGQLNSLGLGAVLQQVQDTVITQLVANLQPLLTALEQNILDITLNKQVKSDGGKKIEVTALDLQVLPAAAQFTGSSLISGQIGHVTCGPNRAAETTPPNSIPQSPQNPESPQVPTVVAAGVAGHGDDTARNVLLATGALMLLAGAAGLAGFRRSLLNK